MRRYFDVVSNSVDDDEVMATNVVMSSCVTSSPKTPASSFMALDPSSADDSTAHSETDDQYLYALESNEGLVELYGADLFNFGAEASDAALCNFVNSLS